MLNLPDDDLSLINDVLVFVCHDRRFQNLDLRSLLGAPREDYLALLGRVQALLDERTWRASVNESVVALWVEHIDYDETRKATVLEAHSFHEVVAWIDDPAEPRSLIAYPSDQPVPLPEVFVANVHRFSQGRAWESNAVPDAFPTPPFLLVNEPRCRPIYRGPVRVQLTNETRAELEQAGRSSEAIPVYDDHWFGLLTLDSPDFGRLVACSHQLDSLPTTPLLPRTLYEGEILGTLATLNTRLELS